MVKYVFASGLLWVSLKRFSMLVCSTQWYAAARGDLSKCSSCCMCRLGDAFPRVRVHSQSSLLWVKDGPFLPTTDPSPFSFDGTGTSFANTDSMDQLFTAMFSNTGFRSKLEQQMRPQ